MYQLVEIFLDLIYPPTYEEKLVRTISQEHITHLYQPRIHKNTIVLSQYKNKQIKALIHCNKYRGNKRAATLLALLLVKHFKNGSNTIQIIPIPLSKERYRERGFNQVEIVLSTLKHMFPELHITIIPALERIRHTVPQTTLDKQARESNLYQAFTLTKHSAVIDPSIPTIIVDDVHTTGATLYAAHACLQAIVTKNNLQRLAFAG